MLCVRLLRSKWNMNLPSLLRSRAAIHSNDQVTACRRSFSQCGPQKGQPTSVTRQAHHEQPKGAPLGHLARRKEEDKQFFAGLLSSAATKRDAKAYISRLKDDRSKKRSDVSNVFGRSTAVTTSPVFEQDSTVKTETESDPEIPHVALVKISNVSKIDDITLMGIASTLAQLARLSMLPCIVLDEPAGHDDREWRKTVVEQVDRLVQAFEAVTETGARKVTDILTIGADGRAFVSMPNLLQRPLEHGKITVVVPIAYDGASQKIVNVAGDQVVVALVNHALRGPPRPRDEANGGPLRIAASIDRVIIIDGAGGIPSTRTSDQMHVFVNMEQEYHALQEELRSSNNARVSPSHASNLSMLRRCLSLLPHTASGLITTPSEAANSSQHVTQDTSSITSVRTRRQRNPLIHNLLTDKPAYSSSLPSSRLSGDSPTLTTSTSVKHGLPLTILPNPAAQAWTPTKKPWIKLTDPRIDLPRLVHLINDSFNRELDVPAYLERVNDNIAGVIIAGDYEGGAILTWERPPYLPADSTRLVPYLDKFAVLKRAQGGGGGVADILFNAMVHTCFPNGVCWRSRKTNPVNKWYFERSRGTWKIPGMDWTMFWTTPDVIVPHSTTNEGGGASANETFLDYEAVCRNVQPTWLDKE